MKPLLELLEDYVVFDMHLEEEPPYIVCCRSDNFDPDKDERFEVPKALAYYLENHWSCTLEKMTENDDRLRREGARAAQRAIKYALDIAYIPRLK